jgi:uncharacterized protein YecE (DUF72 family)
MGKVRSSDRYPGGNHPCVHHAFRKGKFHSLSEDELKEFAGSVRRLAGETKRVHVLFNNCHGDQAQRNASQLRLLLEQTLGG